ncbi:cytoplasmic l-asparaginase i-like protein [Trypanosoma theileri]|uniref:asparaginase n=1 Tax=Trypanosoma theileri TaxID=67003 RepID=A0A1X0NTQ3_9TRYP|nr:cytoplasmic l-asparaginase i-like protein [Trypanosoma theileri]ORC88086.1 cytoplasmic l-asparaginase i-like protein [Trypanosoma theileri]
MENTAQISQNRPNVVSRNPIRFVSYNEGRSGASVVAIAPSASASDDNNNNYNTGSCNYHYLSDDLFPRRERRVLVLYVGGTIGMTRSASGALSPRKGYLTQVVRNMGELQQRPEVAPFDVVEYDVLLDSSNMDGRDYVRIAADVERHYDAYDGFLVLHGTDTMHYTATALSFLLHNLAKPVILTGSMVPLVEPYSDARRNLVISLMLASNPAIREVCVFFNDCLLRGNCCFKLHHTFGAFCSPNYPALGVIEATGFQLRQHLLLPQPAGPLSVESDMSGRVALFVLHPDCDVSVLTQLLLTDRGTPVRKTKEKDSIRSEKEKEEKTSETNTVSIDNATAATTSATHHRRPLLDAVVLEISGVGSLKSKYSILLHQLAEVANKRDIVTCVTVREPCGSLSAAEQLRLRTVSPHLIYLRMTSTAAEVKLMYLFGKGLSPAEVRKEMPRNLRGEVTPGSSCEANL